MPNGRPPDGQVAAARKKEKKRRKEGRRRRGVGERSAASVERPISDAIRTRRETIECGGGGAVVVVVVVVVVVGSR